MTSLTEAPAETLRMSPETLEVANMYLQLNDTLKVANALNISTDIVAEILKKREVKSYIDTVFKDMGYNNRFKMRELMDTVIKKKLSDMAEADIGSNKDIIEILALSHKMSMEQYDKEIALEKIRADNLAAKSQVNVQINNDSTNYGTLLQKLLENENATVINTSGEKC